jgi:hypothetical protein
MVWLRDYKLWEGKSQNKFLWNGEIKGPDRAMELIYESNSQYQSLVKDPAQNEKRKYWLGQQQSL